MKTILPPATLEHPEDQWRIDWLHEHAAVDEEFEYPQVSFHTPLFQKLRLMKLLQCFIHCIPPKLEQNLAFYI